MKDLEQRIREIEDRTAIVELTARYCHEARTGDVEGIVDLFCEDGIMEAGPTREQGHDRLREVYREAFKGLRPLPCVHNHVIELDGDEATGTTSVEIRMVENGEAVTAAGHYDDRFRRVGSSWKFAHRNLTIYHQVPLAKGWA